jgi:hypothetical protein
MKKPSETAFLASAGWDPNWYLQRASYGAIYAVMVLPSCNYMMGYWHMKSKVGTASFMDGHASSLTPDEAIKPNIAEGNFYRGIFQPENAW